MERFTVPKIYQQLLTISFTVESNCPVYVIQIVGFKIAKSRTLRLAELVKVVISRLTTFGICIHAYMHKTHSQMLGKFEYTLPAKF